MWLIMRKFVRKIWLNAVYGLLVCWYALGESSVSAKDKTVIYAALGYFILPFDFIHDWLPFAGIADDFVALAWAISRVVKNVNNQVHNKAESKMHKWFELTAGECEWLEKKGKTNG